MRKFEKMNDEDRAVSPVIATILMVAITVVLAGVLYVWANNLASEGTDTSIGTLNTYTTEDADDETGPGADDILVKMQLTGKDDLAWSFVKITVSVGDNVYTCSVVAGDDCEIGQAAGDNDNSWEPGEYLFLSEGTKDICDAAECRLEISVTHNGRTVAGDGVSGQGGNVGSGSIGGTTTPSVNTFSAFNITTSGDIPSIDPVDMDGDGDMDLLVVDKNTGLTADDEVAWFENDGSESFTKHSIYTEGSMRTAFPIDLDRDGDMDVISGSGDIRWHENDGSESFTSHLLPGYHDMPGVDHHRADANDLEAGDLDGDGDIDIVVAHQVDVLWWYENDGNEDFEGSSSTMLAWGGNCDCSGFVSGSSSPTIDAPVSVNIIDLDGDGDNDVVMGSEYDDQVAWFENGGSGSFSGHTITTSADGVRSINALDFDRDGDIDVLVASMNSNEVVWFENDGSESFTEHLISDSSTRPFSISAGDFDGDGDVDVVTANVGERNWDTREQEGFGVAWYENKGSGNFISHNLTSNLEPPRVVVVTDLDGDGDRDVISSGGPLEWNRNN